MDLVLVFSRERITHKRHVGGGCALEWVEECIERSIRASLWLADPLSYPSGWRWVNFWKNVMDGAKPSLGRHLQRRVQWQGCAPSGCLLVKSLGGGIGRSWRRQNSHLHGGWSCYHATWPRKWNNGVNCGGLVGEGSTNTTMTKNYIRLRDDDKHIM